MNASNILKSTKRPGIYESGIIERLRLHFTEMGYEAVPHARFDLAWGSIISDIDLLVLGDGKITLIEVKSSKDKIGRAPRQIDAVKDFVDEAYLATDYLPRRWPRCRAGRIVVTHDGVRIVKKAPKLDKRPGLDALLSLKRDSLADLLSDPPGNNMRKYEMASQIMKLGPADLKQKLQRIVTCQEA